MSFGFEGAIPWFGPACFACGFCSVSDSIPSMTAPIFPPLASTLLASDRFPFSFSYRATRNFEFLLVPSLVFIIARLLGLHMLGFFPRMLGLDPRPRSGLRSCYCFESLFLLWLEQFADRRGD